MIKKILPFSLEEIETFWIKQLLKNSNQILKNKNLLKDLKCTNNYFDEKIIFRNLIEKSENYTTFIENINKNYQLNKNLLLNHFKDDEIYKFNCLIFPSLKK